MTIYLYMIIYKAMLFIWDLCEEKLLLLNNRICAIFRDANIQCTHLIICWWIHKTINRRVWETLLLVHLWRSNRWLFRDWRTTILYFSSSWDFQITTLSFQFEYTFPGMKQIGWFLIFDYIFWSVFIYIH